MKIKKILCVVLLMVSAIGLAGCGNSSVETDAKEKINESETTNSSEGTKEEKEIIKIGCVNATKPAADIMKEALSDTKYDVEVVVFDGNNLPAEALNAGEIDGLFCNSLRWMVTFNENNNGSLTMPVPYYYSYQAIYSKKIDDISEFPENGEVVCASGLSNIDSALRLLDKVGLITLSDKPSEGQHFSILDITENNKNLKLTPVELVTTMSTIEDVDAVIASAVIVRDSGLMSPGDYLALCDKEGMTPQGLIVNQEDEDAEWVQLADEKMNDQKYYDMFNERFDGTFILHSEFDEKFSEK